MLKDLLTRERAAILQRWSNTIMESYEPETTRFLKSVADKFSNPVGGAVVEGTRKIYDGLVNGVESGSGEIEDALDYIVRIRAVQEFSPAAAVGFVFLLKTVVRETLWKEIHDKKLFEELLDFESRIDGLALLAFNNYVACKATIFQMRATEIRNRTSRILERACQKYGMPSEWSSPEEISKA